MENDTQRAVFELSIESVRIEAVLRRLEVDAAVSYAEILREAKCDVQQRRGPLTSALKRLEKEHRQFETIRGVGIRRVTPARVVAAAQATGPRRLHALGYRLERRMAYVDEAALSAEERYARIGLGALGRLLQQVGRAQIVQVLTSAAAAQPLLTVEETAKLTLDALVQQERRKGSS